MRSFIIVEVEHGETTDPLDEVLDTMGLDENYGLPEGVIGYNVVVDIPPYVSAINAPNLIQRTS